MISHRNAAVDKAIYWQGSAHLCSGKNSFILQHHIIMDSHSITATLLINGETSLKLSSLQDTLYGMISDFCLGSKTWLSVYVHIVYSMCVCYLNSADNYQAPIGTQIQ